MTTEKVLLVIGDDTYELTATKVSTKKSPAKKSPAKKSPAKKTTRGDLDKDLQEQCEELAEKLPKKALRLLLKEYDVKSIDDVDEEDLEDLLADLQEETEEEGGGEIDAEAVKIACQAFAKKNSADDLKDILADYNIKSVRSLGKLNQEDLEDLYADVTED